MTAFVPIIPIVTTGGPPITQLTDTSDRRATIAQTTRGRSVRADTEATRVALAARKSWLASVAIALLFAALTHGEPLAIASEFELLWAQDVFDPTDLPPPLPDSEFVERSPTKKTAPDSPSGVERSRVRVPRDPDDTTSHSDEESVVYEATEGDALSWLVSSGTQLHRGHWYFAGDAILWHRSTPPKQTFSVVRAPTALGVLNVVALESEVPGFKYEPGMRITLGRFLGRDNRNRDHAWEFTYLGLTDWDTAAAVTINRNVFPDAFLFFVPNPSGNLTAFNFALSHSYAYTSDLNSFELNRKLRFRLGRDRLILNPEGEWQRECNPGWTPSFFGGVRVLNVDENFAFVSFGTNANGVSAPEEENARYEIKTNNDLVGLQIGAELFEQHCNWSVGVRGKLGGLVNFAGQQSFLQITSLQNPIDFPEFREASDTQLAFMAELGIVASYQLQPNVALRASYDFMYLQGLALAPQQMQMNFAAPPKLTSGSHIFYDGASVGLEIVW
jgi:hypothetical protein